MRLIGFRHLGAGLLLAGIGVLVSLTLMAAPSWASSPSASLAWEPTTSGGVYNYGTLDLSAVASKVVTFTLKNTDGVASTALTVRVSGSAAFVKTADGCTERSLGPGRSCTVTVKYAPAKPAQSDSATLTASAIHTSASIKLEGKSASPSLAWSRYGLEETISSYDFKTAPMNRASEQLFELTNSGTGTSAPLTTSLNNGSGTAFSIGSLFGHGDECTGKSLAPGASCLVAVAFTPAKYEESYSGTLSAGGASVGLSGVGGIDLGISPGEFLGPSGTANHYLYQFGEVATAQSFTLTNEGEGTTKQLFLLLGAQGFKLHGGTCEAHSLAPGASCTFEVTFEACPFPGDHPRGEFPIASVPGPGRYEYVNLEVIVGPNRCASP